MQKTSLAQYVAQHNMDGANEMLSKYGIPYQTSVVDCAHCINQVIKAKGDNALADLALIHPDRQIIREQGNNDIYARQNGHYSNCDGGGCKCGGKCGGKTSSADGSTGSPIVANQSNIVGIVAVISIAAAIIITIQKH